MGVGRLEKQSPIPRREGEPRFRLPSEDMLIGLYGHKLPIGFLIQGGPDGVAIHLGAWSSETGKPMLPNDQQILESGLNALYPAIDLASVQHEAALPSLCGLAIGIPSGKPPDTLDGTAQIDRLIRAMYGANWACLVLAQPAEEEATSALRQSVINETRWVQSITQAEQAPSPLAEHYIELLKVVLKTLTSGLALGVWRTAVYLLGDEASYYRLASIWRGIFSGEESLPESLKVWDAPYASDWARSWAMPDTPAPRGPGEYHHQLLYQTLLTSTQLAAYIHLPNLETSGFTVNAVPHFDAVPPKVKAGSALYVGKVIQRKQTTKIDYRVSTKDLTRHVFVAGVTGAGKTNTVFHLLKEAYALGVPFLVIEPVKAEYRALLDDPDLGDNLRIFTLGNENISSFRLNPFEAPQRIPVSVHLDLLRSAFTASFGMWTPLPQVLEQCLHRIYEVRGWDITTNANPRLDGRSDNALAFPTLSDLATMVDEVARALGYEERTTADIRAALLTRINSLRTGGKGRMLDVQRSLPMEALLEKPTILELEGMGDDDDKAFVMGLLFIRIVEHRRASGPVDDLRHVLVIEEAHRLLANVGRRGQEEQGDARGKSVETFANLLSEIRAYGQGVVIADQVPVKLAPDVIKNTNLKIAHRIVAADDRAALAGAMAMDERQAHALATLVTGEAVAFSEGDDAPLLLWVPPIKNQLPKRLPDDERVATSMRRFKATDTYRTLFDPLADFLDLSIPGAAAARDAAQALAEDPGFQREFVRFVVFVTETDEADDRLWEGIWAREQAVRRHGIPEAAMRRCLLIFAAKWFATRRGTQAGWTYADTAELEDRLRELLLIRLEGKQYAEALKSFRSCMQRLHHRLFEPYPGCNEICTQGPLCLYRHAVADAVQASSVSLLERWRDAYTEDSKAGEGLPASWRVCHEVVIQLIEDDPCLRPIQRRIGLCVAQHLLAGDLSEIREVIRSELLKETAGWKEGDNGP
jgi:hypothetical protein